LRNKKVDEIRQNFSWRRNHQTNEMRLVSSYVMLRLAD